VSRPPAHQSSSDPLSTPKQFRPSQHTKAVPTLSAHQSSSNPLSTPKQFRSSQDTSSQLTECFKFLVQNCWFHFFKFCISNCSKIICTFFLLTVQKFLEIHQETISFDLFSPIFLSRLFYFSPPS